MATPKETQAIFVRKDLHIDCKLAAIAQGITLKEWAEKVLREATRKESTSESVVK
jgi:predicted HicB family RNase H-like nuclease